jgi:hypothetical protein
MFAGPASGPRQGLRVQDLTNLFRQMTHEHRRHPKLLYRLLQFIDSLTVRIEARLIHPFFNRHS